MMELTLNICQLALFVAIIFTVIRLFRGPRIYDRVLCLDALAVCVIGILVLKTMQWKSPHFIDLILVFSLLNFIGTVAFVFYLNRKKINQEAKTND